MPSTLLTVRAMIMVGSLLLLILSLPVVAESADNRQMQLTVAANTTSGKKIYEFYCYQCHGYAGDARTLASTWLDPQPRNFSTSDPQNLSRDRMIEAVSNGRSGTAMTAFSSVLSGDEIKAVVDYIRTDFMSGSKPLLRYHTPENGWDNHDRYRDAFPFASGEVALDSPWEQLTPQQRNGKQMFMQACISCHDRARVINEGPVWELRALSFPRKHYSHTTPVDVISGASPYALHDQPPETGTMTAAQQRGAQLYQDNCAFCHAADGTARNWIGSFLEPRPRDLTGEQIAVLDNSRLKAVIMDGIDGTSMPAWRHVLDNDQIGDILDYIRQAFLKPQHGATER